MVACEICGRTLTNLNSIMRGIGPICARKEEIAELRAEAQELAKSQPVDLKTEVRMYKAMYQHDVSISGSMMHTFGRTEKKWEKAGWIFVSEYSIHAPERLERDLEEYSQTHLMNAVVYDSVSNGQSRLIVNLWRFPHKKGNPHPIVSKPKRKPKTNPRMKLTLDQYLEVLN